MTLLSRPPDWTLQAACTTRLTPEDFDQATPAARAICASCPVRLPCALDGIAEPIGLRGGLDPNDRRTLAARLAVDPPGAAPHGTRSRYARRRNPCRCDLCRHAHAVYENARRRDHKHRTRLVVLPRVLEHREGRGRWTAWPGQTILFDPPVRLAGADTQTRRIAA